MGIELGCPVPCPCLAGPCPPLKALEGRLKELEALKQEQRQALKKMASEHDAKRKELDVAKRRVRRDSFVVVVIVVVVDIVVVVVVVVVDDVIVKLFSGHQPARRDVLANSSLILSPTRPPSLLTMKGTRIVQYNPLILAMNRTTTFLTAGRAVSPEIRGVVPLLPPLVPPAPPPRGGLAAAAATGCGRCLGGAAGRGGRGEGSEGGAAGVHGEGLRRAEGREGGAGGELSLRLPLLGVRCHVLSCPVMSCHVMSCHVMSCHVPTADGAWAFVVWSFGWPGPCVLILTSS